MRFNNFWSRFCLADFAPLLFSFALFITFEIGYSVALNDFIQLVKDNPDKFSSGSAPIGSDFYSKEGDSSE